MVTCCVRLIVFQLQTSTLAVSEWNFIFLQFFSFFLFDLKILVCCFFFVDFCANRYLFIHVQVVTSLQSIFLIFLRLSKKIVEIKHENYDIIRTRFVIFAEYLSQIKKTHFFHFLPSQEISDSRLKTSLNRSKNHTYSART